MRQAYDRRITYQIHREWEDFQAQIQEVPNTGPTRELYQLFVNGIHSDTTEDSLGHIFSNYGNPISIQLIRTRNHLHQPIAFVEFESQYEADNAIVGLDGKPPLNWKVMYDIRRPSENVQCDDQDFANFSIASYVRRHTGSFQASGAARTPSGSRQSTCSLETEYPSEIMRQNGMFPGEHLQFPSCHVCGKQSSFFCVVCNTRYCSWRCQKRDWPTHQPVCRPPPALSQDIPRCAVSPDGLLSRRVRDCRKIPSPSLQNGTDSIEVRQDQISARNYSSHYQSNGTFELTNPDLYLIKGIHPLDREEKPKQSAAESPVAVRRVLDVGSKRRTDSVQVINVEDGNKASSITEDDDHPESVSFNWHTINPFPASQSNSPSSNFKGDENRYTGTFQSKRDKPKNFFNNGFTRQDSGAKYVQEAAVMSPSWKSSHQQSPKTNKIYAKSFPCMQFKLLSGEISKVNVCWAKSPDEFYVQCYRYHEMLQEIMKNVAISVRDADPLVNPVEGLPCLALFYEDRCWYRAQVLKVLPDGVGIRYVDFGNTIVMPNTSEHLRMMEQALTKDPFHAVKVKLANVLPKNGISWDTDVKVKFKELVENKPFLMEFVQIDADVPCVRLKNQDGSDSLSLLMQENLIKIATLEVSDGQDQIPSMIEIPVKTPARQTVSEVAKPSDSCSQFQEENVVFESKYLLDNTEKEINGSVPTTLIENNVTSSEVQRIETHEVVKSNVAENGLVLSEIVRNPQELPEKKMPQGFLHPIAEVEAYGPDPACLSSEGNITEDGSSTVFYYDDGPFLDLPEKESFQAMIIKSENPQCIILRVENHEISTKLTKLQEELAIYANDIPYGYHPKLDEICVARFPDGQWYRAVCLEVIPDRQSTEIRYSCNQVDHGEMYVLDVNEIRPARKWMMDLLPYLAQHAILKGTDSMKQLEPKLVQRFSKILPESTVVDVNVVSRDDMSYVVLIPKVNATLSFEGLLPLDNQNSTE